jgi:hypothetical protein
MDYGLIDIPQSKWGSGTGRQVILKGDFAVVEAGVLQSFGLQGVPTISWVDNTSIKVAASPDDIAAVMLNGFPSVLHPKRFITAGLTDGRYRENTADVVMDFDLSTNFWGTEKASQWYAIYALAGNADLPFTLKAMPWMRVKSQTGQVISLGTLATPATGIGYGVATDELVGASIYFISGASKGLLRSITANNNDNSTGGTITYSGAALTVAVGDWFIILPNTNFRYLRSIFNNSASNIITLSQVGDVTYQSGTGSGTVENITSCSPLASELYAAVVFSGQGNVGWSGTQYGYIYFGNNIVPMARWDSSLDGGGNWYASLVWAINCTSFIPVQEPCRITVAATYTPTISVIGYRE